jgi:hypothetical protein
MTRFCAYDNPDGTWYVNRYHTDDSGIEQRVTMADGLTAAAAAKIANNLTKLQAKLNRLSAEHPPCRFYIDADAFTTRTP